MQGPEKSLLEIGGKPLAAHIRDRLASQIDRIAINANGDPERFAFLELPVLPDIHEGFAGPLAGLHAGMAWVLRNNPECGHLVTVAADTPFFPANLVAGLSEAATRPGEIVLAGSDGHRHPVFGIWPVAHFEDLDRFLKQAESRKIMAFVERHPNRVVEFPMVAAGNETLDPFFNINTPEELEWAQANWQEFHEGFAT